MHRFFRLQRRQIIVFLKFLLDDIQNLLAVCHYGMVVVAGGGAGKQSAFTPVHLRHVMGDVQAGADVQFTANHAVHPVVDKNIFDGAAQIHNSGEFVFHFIFRVDDLKDASRPAGASLQ